MKWLDNWILKRAKRIRNRDTAPEEALYQIDRSGSNDRSIGTPRHRMNFTMYRANGGVLVEINHYDDRRDQHQCELHIVHPDQNLGDALAKIVTFESLKL